MQNSALNSIAQAENVSQQIDIQNDQLRDQHLGGIASLVGGGIGLAYGGPAGALAGSRAGAAIF